MYEKGARERGFHGDVYHPTIQIIDGQKSIYIDWLMQGLNVGDRLLKEAFPTLLNRVFLGKHTIKDVWKICKVNSLFYR